MSILRRTSRFALLLLPALPLALPSAAEIVAVGEPFPIESDPFDAASGLDVAWLPPGAGADQPAGFLVAWDAEAAAGSAIWRALVPQDTSAPPQPPLLVAGPGSFSGPAVAVGLDRRSAIAFRAGSPLCLGGFLYGPSSETEAALQPTAAPCNALTLDAALLPGGRLIVAWEHQSMFTVSDLLGQGFAADGEPVGEPFVLAQTGELLRLREVVPVPGGFLALFVSASQNSFTPMGPSALRVQRFDEEGGALAPPVEVRDAPGLVEDLSIVPVSGGFVAVWTEWALLSQSPVQFGRDVFARRLDANGAPAGHVVPLLDAALGASFTAAAAAPGPGDSVLLAWLAEAGADALDLRTQLLTADLAAASATVTFATRSSGISSLHLAAGPAGDALAVWAEDGALLAQRLVVEGECTPSETVLCLQGGRFAVSVEWADFQGNAGPGRRVPVASDDSGLFWFFHPDNWEMLVKVLDACPLDGHFWVFAAAATNVEYTLTVSDLVAHQTRIFRNDLGETARALTVTDAFPTCGAGGGGG
jgi:hypothetical protein